MYNEITERDTILVFFFVNSFTLFTLILGIRHFTLSFNRHKQKLRPKETLLNFAYAKSLRLPHVKYRVVESIINISNSSGSQITNKNNKNTNNNNAHNYQINERRVNEHGDMMNWTGKMEENNKKRYSVSQIHNKLNDE